MGKQRLKGGAGRGVLPNGRSVRGPPFVRIYHYVFDSPAYRSLKPGPRALLSEVIRRYNGINNGRIGLGVREACVALNMSDKDTMSSYFEELVEKGLLAVERLGGFNMKDRTSHRATEWRLTWERFDNQPPTKDFLRWKVGIEQRSGISGS